MPEKENPITLKKTNTNLTPETFQNLVEKYLNENDPKKWTLSGLVLATTGSQEIFDELTSTENFADIIAQARLHILSTYEERLKDSSSSGAVFALKNIAQWQDAKASQKKSNPKFTWQTLPL